MAEATTSTPKAKAAKPAADAPEASKYEASAFEMPKFEMPKFEMPKFDVPVAFREFTEKGVAQAKDTYDKMKSAAEDSTAMLEDTYAACAKGTTTYNLKLIEAARANTNATFDFFSQFATVKSLSEAVELSSAHARKQFEAMSAQTKELTTLAQKCATDAAEPMKSGLASTFGKFD